MRSRVGTSTRGLILALLAVAACKGKASPPGPVPSASATVAASPPASAPPTPSAAPSSAAAAKVPASNPSLEDVRKVAQQRWDELRPALESPNVDCGAVLAKAEASLASAAYKPKPEDAPRLTALARCAEDAQRWQLLGQLAGLLDAAGAESTATVARGRALLGLGEYEDALRTLAPAVKGPAKDPDAVLTMGLAGARLGDFDGAAKRADQALALAGKGADGPFGVAAHVLKADALFRRGKLDDALRELDAAEKVQKAASIDALRAAITTAKEKRLAVDVETPSHVFLGLYTNYGRPPFGPLATIRLYNVGNRTVALRTEAALPGITQTAAKQLKLVAAYEAARLTPPFSPLFDPASVPAPQAGTIAVKVADDSKEGAAYVDETRETRVFPAAYVPLALHTHGDELRVTHELLATRVNASAPALAPVIEGARQRGAGDGADTETRARALWEELAARGITFSRAAEVVPDDAEPRLVRNAGDVLESKHGDAYEGAVLTAGALAALGLDPVLVVVPGHAFTGWLATKNDRKTGITSRLGVPTPLGDAYFLEITSLGQRPFETAVLRGNAEFVDNGEDGAFTQRRASLVRVPRGPRGAAGSN